MGSPGAFIHSGALGGRLAASLPACSARAPAPLSPPIAEPPANAALACKKLRRDALRDLFSVASFMEFPWMFPELQLSTLASNAGWRHFTSANGGSPSCCVWTH